MRKGVHTTLGYIVLTLVALLIWLSFARVGGGRAEDIMNEGLRILDWCPTADYAQFMDAIKNTYYKCQESQSNCGKKKCVIVRLSDGTKCNKIGKAQVQDKIGDMFNDLPGTLQTPCGTSNRAFWQSEIDIYNIYGNDAPYCKYHDLPFISYGEYFEIVNGARVTMNGIHPDRGGSVDVELKISGGSKTDYSEGNALCPYAPSSKDQRCNTDADCLNKAYVSDGTENNHIYCGTDKLCTHNGYCNHFCDSDKGTCPPSVSGKCIPIKASCVLNGDCTASPGYSLTNSCSSGAKMTITGLEEKYRLPAVMIKTEPVLSPSSLDFTYAGASRYYRKVSVPYTRLEELFNNAEGEIRISLEVAKVDADNSIVAYQGCY